MTETTPGTSEAFADLVRLVLQVDSTGAANAGASIVTQLAVLSFLIEKKDVTIADIEQRMSDVRASAAGFCDVLNLPAVVVRCDAIVGILKHAYPDIGTQHSRKYN